MTLLKNTYQINILVMVTVCFLEPLYAQEKSQSPDTEQYLKIIIEGYRQNQEAFNAFTCRFRRIYGQALTVEEALQGKLKRRCEVQGLWQVHGEKVHFSLQGDKHSVPVVTVKDDTKPNFFFGFPALGDAEILSNGSYTISCSPWYGIGNIFSPQSPFLFNEEGPFPLERGCPADQIKECLAKKFPYRYEGMQEVKGRRLMTVWISTPSQDDPNRLEARLFFDPQRGFLPIQCEYKQFSSQQPTRDMWNIITDIRECSENRWFPMRRAKLIKHWPGKDWRPVISDFDKPFYEVWIIEVNELDLRAPADEEFTAELPAGMLISDPVSQGHFYLPAPLRVGLKDLERIWQRCRLPTTEGGLEVLEQQPSRPWGLLLVVTVLALLAIALGLSMRLRRRKAIGNR
jgi:hypothetical protein